jgi:hypothetical protein
VAGGVGVEPLGGPPRKQSGFRLLDSGPCARLRALDSAVNPLPLDPRCLVNVRHAAQPGDADLRFSKLALDL